MNPLFGFIIFAICAIIVGVVAGKRLGALYGLAYLIVVCIAAFLLVVVASRATGGNGLIAGFVAFGSPIIGLIIALSTATSERKAVLTGEHGEYKKCPFCAEPIRKEAIKCKHCGSDVRNELSLAKQSEFRPQDIPFDMFFKQSDKGLILNEASVHHLIEGLKQANPGAHPMNIEQRYKKDIEDLVNALPSGIRGDFMRVYSAGL